MRATLLTSILTVFLWAAPAQAAVVSVNADGLMNVQVPEGGDLLVECHRPSADSQYCDVLFASQFGGQVTGVAPACVPQTIGGRVRCTGVSSRNVTMGSGDDTLTITSSANVGYGGLFGGTIDMGAGNDTVRLGESYGSDVILAGPGTDTVSYEKRFGALNVTVGGGRADGSFAEADDIHAEVLEGGRGHDVLSDVAGATAIFGGQGDDTITGGSGANLLDGGFGNDTIDGLAGDDVITGGPETLPSFVADADVLTGGPGADTIAGGAGADQLLADDGTADSVDCGEQHDAARADRIDTVGNCEDEDLGAPIELSIADVSVDENAGEAIIEIAASAGNARTMSVRAQTVSGTAVAGEDFAGRDVVATIAPGATAAEMRIPIVDDEIDEDDLESFTVTLSEPMEAVSGGSDGTVAIADDDDAPTVALDAVENVDEGGTATVTARLAEVSGRTVRVDLATTDGSAEHPADYAFADAGRITIPAGSLTGTALIATTDDEIDEDDETFEVGIDGTPVNAVATGGPRQVTIRDNDDMPTVTVADDEVIEGEQLVVRVSQSALSSRPVTVGVSTVDGEARAGSDYTAFHGTVTIPAGSRHTEFVIRTTADKVNERPETFQVTLNEPVNASLARATATMTIINSKPRKPKPKPRGGTG